MGGKELLSRVFRDVRYFVMYNTQFLPKFLREKQGCALYTLLYEYSDYMPWYNNGHNPEYNVYKNAVCVVWTALDPKLHL